MRDYRADILAGLLLIGVTLVAFGRVCDNDFVNYDDLTYVTENPHVHAGLTRQSTWWALTTFHFSNWHPLTWLSYQLDYELWGLKAWGYHLTNLLWHVANSVLLYVVLRRMTGAIWRSFFIVALFAVHPLHVESVAWVSERKDVLSTFFGLLALGAYGWYAERPRWGRYLLVVLAFALGLMSKPMLVTWPCVLLLLDYWPLCRWATTHHSRFASASLGWLLVEKVPLFVLAAAAGVVAFLAQSMSEALGSSELYPLRARILNALVAYGSYLGKMVWPANLAVFYPYPYHTLPVWQAAGAGVLLVGISVGVLRQVRRRPYLLVGWLWYVGTLVPVIGLVQVGMQAMADRYAYVPLIGMFVLLVWGIADLAVQGRWWPVVRGAAAGAVLAACMACTSLQVGHWQNSCTLWKHTLQATDDNFVAHYNLGLVFEQQGERDKALEHFSMSVQIYPYYPRARNNLGLVLRKKGRLEEAIEHYRAALGINPDYVEAHNNLGAVLGMQGKLPEASHHFSEAVRLAPNDAEAHNNLGLVLRMQGKLSEAVEHYAAALRINPDYAEAHNNLGAVLGMQGKLPEAVHHFSEAIRLVPDHAPSHHNLGEALAMQGKLKEAVACYQQAVHLQPQVVPYRCSLAFALHEQGQTEAAQEQYREVLRLEPNWAQTAQQTAWTLATHPDPQRRHGIQALQLAQQLCQATQNQRPECLDTLAAAYAETGRFDEAMKTAHQALTRALANKEPELNGTVA